MYKYQSIVVILQVTNAETDIMQAETQNYSQPTMNNEVSNETSSITVDTQNTLLSTTVWVDSLSRFSGEHQDFLFVFFQPFVIRPPAAQSTLTDGSSISADQGNQKLFLALARHSDLKSRLNSNRNTRQWRGIHSLWVRFPIRHISFFIG